MKGDFIFAILQALEETAKNASDVFGVLATIGYVSPKNLEYLVRKNRHLKTIRTRNTQPERRYRSFLGKLKREGLIRENGIGDRRTLSITKKGLAKLHKLAKSTSRLKYEKYRKGALIMFAFDIPERKRGARHWIRKTLRQLDYRMIQKSLWVGNSKLPQSFIYELHRRHLIDHVEISIIQSHTLQKFSSQ